MKHVLIIIFLSATFTKAFAQNNFEPQILILSPANVHYDKVFENEISDNNLLIRKENKYQQLQKESSSKEFQKQPANIKQMIESEITYSKSLDFIKQISFMSEEFLTYRFIDKFPTLLIKLSNTASTSEIAALKKISEQEKLQYVLNFPSVAFYKQDGISFSKIAVQLYDQASNALLIDTAYTGNWDNPGFEFACKVGTLNCTINNALSQALDNILYTISANSPTLIKERKLSKDRLDVLMTDYYKKPFDKTFITSIITDSNIHSATIYQGMISADSTKFVAFFLEKVTAQNFKQLKDNETDNNVSIINGKNIKDSGYLNDIPQTYAYIIKAVKYNGQWYYEKSNATYFEPEDNEEGRLQFLNNLQEWNFFKDGSTEFNPDFWETNLFAKVKDLRKDPDWDKYGTTIWKTDEEENRNYIGLYEIVANQLKNKSAVKTKHIIMN